PSAGSVRWSKHSEVAVAENGHLLTLRRLTPRLLAVLSAGCLAALMAGPASAATAQSVINASLNDVSCPSAANCMAVGSFLGQIPGTSGFRISPWPTGGTAPPARPCPPRTPPPPP